MEPLTRERLAELLRDAEEAHGEFEAQLGRPDDDWPDWYADYVVSRWEEEG